MTKDRYDTGMMFLMLGSAKFARVIQTQIDLSWREKFSLFMQRYTCLGRCLKTKNIKEDRKFRELFVKKGKRPFASYIPEV